MQLYFSWCEQCILLQREGVEVVSDHALFSNDWTFMCDTNDTLISGIIT